MSDPIVTDVKADATKVESKVEAEFKSIWAHYEVWIVAAIALLIGAVVGLYL